MLLGKAFNSFFFMLIDFLHIERMMIYYFANKLFSLFWEISKQIFRFFTFLSRKYQNNQIILQNDNSIHNEVKSEDHFKSIEFEFFNLLKKYSIEEVEQMNISYIKSLKLNNGRIAFKYPEFNLKYDDLPLNQLTDEKIYYLKTLFNNYKLIDSFKEEDGNISYPQITLDENNNITSLKEKLIKIPYDDEEKYRIQLNEETESKFEQINKHYEVYVYESERIFKVGISVKMFRVISAFINKSNKENGPPPHNFGIYNYFMQFKYYSSYWVPHPIIADHMGHFLQYSIYDKEKSLFYLYFPYETAEKCMRILYNLSWVAYNDLFIDPRDPADPGWFECDTFLEYIKLIHPYHEISPLVHPINPLKHSKLFSYYGYEFPGEPLANESTDILHPLRKR